MAQQPLMEDDIKESNIHSFEELGISLSLHNPPQKGNFFVIISEKRSNWYDVDNNNLKIEDFKQMGETEVIKDESNNNDINNKIIFNNKIPIDYHFEETQILKFELYNLKQLIGSCEVYLGEILSSQGSTKLEYILNIRGKPLKNHNEISQFEIEINQKNGLNRDILFEVGPSNLPKMDTFGSADAYFKIYKLNNNDNSKKLLFDKRNIIKDIKKNNWILYNYKKNIKKFWPTFSLSMKDLCDFNINKQCIIFELWDADQSSNDDLIGESIYSFQELQSKISKKILLNKKNQQKERGNIIIKQCKILPKMIDFIQSGTEISLHCAIDLTGSNGDPSDETSLHYCPKSQLLASQYQQAIRSIGGILSKYDSDQKYPVYGFGIAIDYGKNGNKNWQVYHDLELNKFVNNSNTSYVNGIYGIEQLYLNTINKIQNDNKCQLSGPTNFSLILSKVILDCKKSHDYFIKSNFEGSLNYHILLLLTDGAISKSDENKTKDLIIEASNNGYPLSIIIIGIGNEDFGFLKLLDSDNKKFKNSKGIELTRDIVQFIPFNNYKQLKKSLMYQQLAKDTLIELPSQFLSYINMHNIIPPKKTQFIYDNKYESKLEELEDNKQDSNYNNFNQYGNYDDSIDVSNCPLDSTNDDYKHVPLPNGWAKQHNNDGYSYYINHKIKGIRWVHPNDKNGDLKAPLPKGWKQSYSNKGYPRFSFKIDHKITWH